MDELFDVNIWSPRETASAEVKAFAKISGDLDFAIYEKLKKGALKTLCGRQMTPASWRKLELDCQLVAKKAGKEVTPRILAEGFSGLLSLFQALFKVAPPKLKPSHVRVGLEGLKLSEALLKDLEETVFGEIGDQARAMLRSSSGSSLVGLDSVNWSVDGILSTSNVSGLMQPSVKLEMRLSDGSTKRIELSLPQFQHLRYAVASQLRDMNELENRTVFRA